MSDRSTALVDVPSEVSGRGRPLVLVPGGLTGRVSWKPIADRLAATRTALAERLPNAEVAEWPGGHAPHLVSTEPFLERMRVFQQQARTGGTDGRH